MRTSLFFAIAAVLLSGSSTAPPPSGNLGVYAIIDRVVFEPNERAPVRLQVHGSFAFVDGGINQPTGVTQARRGLMRFILPSGIGADYDRRITAIKREWSDLKDVAGTGQAVGFGAWFYLGQFSAFRPDARRDSVPRTVGAGGRVEELRVTASTDTTATPMWYETNVGVVKLTEASHAQVIAALRAARR